MKEIYSAECMPLTSFESAFGECYQVMKQNLYVPLSSITVGQVVSEVYLEKETGFQPHTKCKIEINQLPRTLLQESNLVCVRLF